MPFVYMLRCCDGSLYTGAAKDLQARVRQHEAGTASRYTRARRPVLLVWSRRVRTWGRALREEHRIKKLKRRDKDSLVSGAGSAGHARGRYSVRTTSILPERTSRKGLPERTPAVP
ncbi:MAG TPA: GIY-YIG nuclease family protein [Vicinamibacteria bacterium]|nr:GIY-YIG nuclease family protein [Vicinamibacteria bacterium]